MGDCYLNSDYLKLQYNDHVQRCSVQHLSHHQTISSRTRFQLGTYRHNQLPPCKPIGCQTNPVKSRCMLLGHILKHTSLFQCEIDSSMYQAFDHQPVQQYTATLSRDLHRIMPAHGNLLQYTWIYRSVALYTHIDQEIICTQEQRTVIL